MQVQHRFIVRFKNVLNHVKLPDEVVAVDIFNHMIFQSLILFFLWLLINIMQIIFMLLFKVFLYFVKIVVFRKILYIKYVSRIFNEFFNKQLNHQHPIAFIRLITILRPKSHEFKVSV